MRKNSNQLSIIDFLGNYRGSVANFGELNKVNYQHLSIDSRTINTGDLFVALIGENFDGHHYALNALQKGASAVVVGKKWWEESSAANPAAFSDKSVIVVEDTLNFLQELAHWHRRKYDLPVLGITGSSGKPTAGVITNIGKGHIGFFGSKAEIYQEKKALFDALTTGQPIFINIEDPFLKNYPADGRKAITVGLDPAADVWGKITGKNYLGCYRFLLYGKYPAHLKIPGQHNVMNALLAAAVGLEFGLDEEEIVMGLESFSPSEKRMEIVEKDGVIFVNDAYNANPDSMKAALRYLAEFETDGKRIAVLGDMLELGEFADEEHQAIAKTIAELPIDAVFAFGQHSKLIAEFLQKNAGSTVIAEWHNSHKTIAEALKKMLSPGDIVLLKGSRSMKMESVLSLLEDATSED